MQAEIATPIGTANEYDADGTTVKTGKEASGGTFWVTPTGYGGFGVDKDLKNATRGTRYGSGSSVFTQASTAATA